MKNLTKFFEEFFSSILNLKNKSMTYMVCTYLFVNEILQKKFPMTHMFTSSYTNH